jgi:hypothetical protein
MSKPIQAMLTVNDARWRRVPLWIARNWLTLADVERHEVEGLRVIVVWDGEIPERRAPKRIAGETL